MAIPPAEIRGFSTKVESPELASQALQVRAIGNSQVTGTFVGTRPGKHTTSYWKWP